MGKQHNLGMLHTKCRTGKNGSHCIPNFVPLLSFHFACDLYARFAHCMHAGGGDIGFRKGGCYFPYCLFYWQHPDSNIPNEARSGDVSKKKTGRPYELAPLTSILHLSGLGKSVPSMMYTKCGQKPTEENCSPSGNSLYWTTSSLEICCKIKAVMN